MKILLVEDDKATARILKKELLTCYIVKLAFSGKEGEYLTSVHVYDLIILDFFLQDIDCITLCQRIRKNHIKTPILIINGVNEVKKRITALDSGADDYLTNPFSLEEMRARIRALLRRSPDLKDTEILTLADLELDLMNKTVHRGKKLIILRRKELQILEYFMRNRGKIISRDTLLEHLWDNAYESFTNTIDVHIKYLRDQIDKPFAKKLIKTVYGLGYKIEG